MTKVNYGGVGFSGLLAVAFIVLKLTGYIAWSWVWVLSPLWIPIVLVLTILLIVLAIMIVAAIAMSLKN